MACHHCGHREPVPGRCSDCSSTSVARHGAGTERLQHELAALLDDGDFPVFRLDADAPAGGGPPPRADENDSVGAGSASGVDEPDVGALLRRFEAADCGILLGTQMVAKGHDFPDVTLGVVLDADATLRFPDFRAEERTFALVAQLAGRAGRGPGGGRVIVQTLAPDAPAIVRAAHHDAAGFLEEELSRREALRYPPFSDLIRVVCASAQPGAAAEACGAVARRLGTPPAAAVLGPAPLFRLRGRERSQLVVKAGDRAAAVRAVGEAVAAVAADREHRRGAVLVGGGPPQAPRIRGMAQKPERTSASRPA